MTKRMLIDATHAEETRVVVLDGNRLEDFDVETSTKRQLKGNIYLAKVVRVEPSLQAAFVEYGGNRHGFLAFSEIHPDYYQIPVADRQRLIDQEAEEAQREEEEADREIEAGPEASSPPASSPPIVPAETGDASGSAAELVRNSVPEPEPFASAPDTPWAAPEPGDSIAGGAAMAVAEDATTAEAAHSDLGDGVTGAAAVAPTDRAPEPDDSVPSPADLVAPDITPGSSAAAAAAANPVEAELTGPAAELPAEGHATPALADAAPEQAAPEHRASEHRAPGHEAPEDEAPEHAGPEHSALAQIATRPDASEHAATQHDAPEQVAPEHVLPEHLSTQHAAPEHGASGHGPSEPGEEPDPPARRAQPMVITQDTLTGPVESGTGSDEADALTLPNPADAASEADTEHEPGDYYSDSIPESPPPETVGGEPDSADEQRERRPPSRYLRNYKIQEVIRRRQILLVQVVKEERGTKGAALTTYMSLAGRFSVLMPNSPRGGGISRKITSATDRRRLKEVVAELEMPKGMGLIVRTAGANRPKPEIKRDCEYLLRLWDDIREHTLKSVAPALIYEEASLIKRAIRDVYSRDIDEILVDGEDGWRAAHEFMRMLMPSHAKKVQLWRDPSQPLFAKYQVEAQLDGMLQPTVQLRSGGYLVINQTEALVAIDVNSGRSTRERNVEETALRTNMEAADEVARQLRLRDLAGLIVIDFIDMEQKKHNSMVERRIKDALKNDRARIQLGHISHFGLMEMSRQRLRPSLAEASFILCPHCGGTGHVRSTENAAIHVLRGIEDEGSKRRAAEIVVHAATPIALYILNHKRDRLGEIERRYAMRVTVMGDDTLATSQFRIDRMRPQIAREDGLAAITPDAAPQAALPAPRWEPEEVEDVVAEDETDTDLDEPGTDEAVGEENDAEEAGAEEAGAEEAGAEEVGTAGTETAEEKAEQAERRRRRRRRRRGGRREDGPQSVSAETASGGALAEPESTPAADRIGEEPGIAAGEEDDSAAETHIEGVPEHAEPVGDDDARRRRGRRGGRRRRREPGEGEGSPFAAPGAEQPDLPPVYIGPTPANPFGGHAFDIFDVLEQVEASAAVRQEPAEPAPRQSLREPEAEALPAGAQGVAPQAEPEGVAAPAEPEGVAAPAELVARQSWFEPEAVSLASGLEGAAAPAEPEGPADAMPAEPGARQSLLEPEAVSSARELEGAAASVEPDSSATPAEPVSRQSLLEPEAAPLASERGVAAAPAEPDGAAASDEPDGPSQPVSLGAILANRIRVRDLALTTPPEPPSAPSALEIVNTTAPEPVPAESIGDPTVAESTVAEAGTPPVAGSGKGVQAEAANDVAPEPAIKPIVIGSGDEPAEKKRGWWRR